MKEPVIVQRNIKTKIQLEDKYDFYTSITIGLANGGDFYLVIDFLDLSTQDFKTLVELGKLTKRLSIKSELFDREQYNVTHIFLEKRILNSNHAMTWECLSDDPSLYTI